MTFCDPEGASLFFPRILNHLGPAFYVLNLPLERITPSPPGRPHLCPGPCLFPKCSSSRRMLRYFCILGQTRCPCVISCIKKAEHQRIDAFELWYWRRLLTVLWTARRSNQSILKEISPEYSLEGLMLKLKLQYFGHLLQRTDSLETPGCWERLKMGGEGDNRG